MRNRIITGASLAGIALLATGCTTTDASATDVEPAAQAEEQTAPAGNAPDGYEVATIRDDVVVPDGVDVSTIYVKPGAQPLGQADIDSMDPAKELRAVCDDPEAIEANADHEPAGTPTDWDGRGDMPNPECHPDFIEVEAWDIFDDYHACWEGQETSTTMRTADMTDGEAFRILWTQSQARANYEWPDADRAVENMSEPCVAAWERNGHELN